MEHQWEPEREDHDCSYVDCYCDHIYCERCGVEKDTEEAEGPCQTGSRVGMVIEDRWRLADDDLDDFVAEAFTSLARLASDPIFGEVAMTEEEFLALAKECWRTANRPSPQSTEEPQPKTPDLEPRTEGEEQA